MKRGRECSCVTQSTGSVHPTRCETNSWWDLAAQLRELSSVLCDDPEGSGGGRPKREG